MMNQFQMSCVKGILFLTVWSIFLVSTFSQQTYACSTCDKAPWDLETYFTVMDKLLGVLDTPPYEQWTGNQFAEDGKEILFTAKTAIQSVATTTMMSFVLVVHTAFLDMWWELKTLASTQARRRDREMLQSYDRKIMMKWLTIGQRAYMGKDISEDQLKKIDQILSELKYVELNKIWWSYITPLKQATYDDILALYRNINYLYKKLHEKKWFHSFLEDVWSEYEVIDSLKKAETVESPEREILKNFRHQLQILVEWILREQQQENRGPTAQLLNFKEDYKLFAAYVWQIQQDYECAIWTKNQCDTTWKQTISESWENTKGRKSDFQKSKDMFSDARARLLGTFWWWWDDAQEAARQREEALLQSFYGGPVPEKRKWWSVVKVQGDVDSAAIKDSLADLEQTVVTTKWLAKRLKDNFKEITLKNSLSTLVGSTALVTNYLASPLGAFVDVSNLPQDASQADAWKYLSKSEKEEALNKYIEKTVATRWLDQEIQLQWVFAGQKTKVQAEAVTKTFSDIFALQQDRERETVYADVRSATVLFPVLSASVWRNIELRWDKNEPSGKESSTIYNAAGKVCELQCSNLQWKCWYYTN